MTDQIQVTSTSNTAPVVFTAENQTITVLANTFTIGKFDSDQNIQANTSGFQVTLGLSGDPIPRAEQVTGINNTSVFTVAGSGDSNLFIGTVLSFGSNTINYTIVDQVDNGTSQIYTVSPSWADGGYTPPAGSSITTYLSTLRVNQVNAVTDPNLFGIPGGHPSYLDPGTVIYFRGLSNFKTTITDHVDDRGIEQYYYVSPGWATLGYTAQINDSITTFETIPVSNTVASSTVISSFTIDGSSSPSYLDNGSDITFGSSLIEYRVTGHVNNGSSQTYTITPNFATGGYTPQVGDNIATASFAIDTKISIVNGTGSKVGIDYTTDNPGVYGYSATCPTFWPDSIWLNVGNDPGAGAFVGTPGNRMYVNTVFSNTSVSLTTGSIFGASNTVFSTGLNVAQPFSRNLGYSSGRPLATYLNPGVNYAYPVDLTLNSFTVQNLHFLTPSSSTGTPNQVDTYTNNNNFPMTVKVTYSININVNGDNTVGLATWIQQGAFDSASENRYGYTNTNAPQQRDYSSTYANANTGAGILRLQPGDYFRVYVYSKGQGGPLNGTQYGNTNGYLATIDIIEY